MSFKELAIGDFSEAHFDFWSKGLLLVARSGDKTNAMTIGWGGIGVMWGKPVAFIVVRPERFTHELIEGADGYSICALDDEYKSALSLCGTVSGRDRDKLAECGLSTECADGVPYISEARIALICKKLSATPFLPEQISGELDKWYGAHGGYHTLYIGEIAKILEKRAVL